MVKYVVNTYKIQDPGFNIVLFGANGGREIHKKDLPGISSGRSFL